jgi:integrase/recombinase XerD
MLDAHLTSPVTRRRLRSGPAASHIDGFADWLHRRGYRPATLDTTLRSLAGWTDWMRSAGFGADDMPAGLDACAAALRERPRVRHGRGPNRKSLEAARLLLRFLREQGALPPVAAAPSPAERWPVLGEFRAWARQHRGLAETSIDAYQRILAELLASVGDDPRAYTAEALRGFVLERARRHRIARAKTVVVATRAFLCFLGATGRCPPGMEHAIPGFASWQLSWLQAPRRRAGAPRVCPLCRGQRRHLRPLVHRGGLGGTGPLAKGTARAGAPRRGPRPLSACRGPGS